MTRKSRSPSAIPRCPRPPAIPLAPPGEFLEAVRDERPVAERLAALPEILEAAAPEIPAEQGATEIPTRETFEALSQRDDVPGALGVREVKFLIAGVDTASPKAYFLNTKNIKYHYVFARDVLNVGLSNDEFYSVTYFVDNRRFLAGTLLAHDAFGDDGLYALEFWPTDPVKVNFVDTAFGLISAAMPFAGERLAYHPSGLTQEDLYLAEQAEFESRGIPAVKTDAIFENVTYSPLNLGIGFGKLRVIDNSDPQPPSVTDVVIFKTLPNDLSHVAGVLSEEPQTPLSHINLKAKQNDTPNAYLRDASSDDRIAPLIDSIVRFEVASDDIRVREATREELEEFLEEQRPDEPQFPPRDLSVTEIVNLDDIGHDALDAIGAKAANLGELRSILAPEIVPAGFAVPFYFYDRFMTETGLYDRIREVIGAPDFVGDPQVRETELRKIRRAIKDETVPVDLRNRLGDLQAQFPEGINPRCRSSTNNEDLVGFNGAGLYDSYTHREDEGHLSKSIKQVWASLWNYRAFEEREFYRIDHFQAAMGVLVHPNFDDELANGVALTKNIYFPDWPGFYVNVQVGESLVTNPDEDSVPEEFLIMMDVDLSTPGNPVFQPIYIRRSNQVEAGQRVLSAEQVEELTGQMQLIHAHFREVYQRQGDDAFAMDLEFKIDKTGQLAIKQARPWVD